MERAGKIAIVFFIPLLLLLFAVEINTFNKNFYIKSYKENNVEAVTGKSINELMDITEDLLDYLSDEADEKILESNFNEREILHMIDVKLLFKYGYMLKYISLTVSIFIVGYFLVNKKIESLGRILFYSPFIWWAAILLLFILSLSDFNKYFTYFHLIFFNNDLWILNPKTDLLIQMLPQNFFMNIFKNIVLLFLIMLAIIQLLGYILMKKGKVVNGRTNKF
ncbi:MAG: TIGR01906 family membrane protein [Tissierellia bacterium]|nr:TIGR01906 family membrane protein [Tissierellia bacterium]